MPMLDLIMEAQKTYVWMRWTCHDKSYLLPPLTAVVIESCSDYLLWNSLARVGAILSHWDYSVPSPDDQHKQAKSITETAAISSSRRSLGLPIFPPPDLCQWLMQLSSFSGAVQRFCEDAARGASAEIRLAAVNALGAAAVSDSSTISLMRDLLCQEDVRLRLSAATTLAYAGFIDEASVSVLRTALWEADDSIKQQAAEALGSVRNWDAASAEALRSALNNISWSIRGTAVEALGRIDNANANVVAILESALRDERSEIRLAGIGVVGRIGARDAITVSSLRRSLSDDDWHIATAAAETLARIGFSNSQCLSIVHSHAKASDAYNRVVACEVLGKMTATDAESLSLLRAALNDPEWAVRYAAAGSLSILSPESVGSPDRIAIYSLFRVATQSSEWAIRLAAVEALGCCGRHADSHLLLCEATSDTNKHVRAAAANSIGKVRCVSIALTAALCTLLSDEYWNVRRAASEALGKILAQDGDTLLLLVERLHDDDIRVGRAASLALKYVSYHITDAIVMKKLLESAHSAFVTADLEMTHSIHVALLRVLPRTYLRLFNDFQEYLNVENVKKMFVMSIWLHCSNISADIASNPVTVRLNGSIHQFTCSDTETALFFDQLQKLESDIIHSKCGDMACAYKTAYVNDTPALLLLNLSANPYSIK